MNSNDRIIDNVEKILEESSKRLDIEVISLILYGSRASNSRNTQNEYELIVLVGDNTSISNFIKFTNILRIELIKESLFQVKILAYTPAIFEDILYNDKSVGTFLYMLCKENIIIYDKHGDFASIIERISSNSIKYEEEFIKQCIEFSSDFGSDKWKQKWEKTLMQYNYLKKRREY